MPAGIVAAMALLQAVLGTGADAVVQLLIRPRCLAGERERPVWLRLVDGPFTAVASVHRTLQAANPYWALGVVTFITIG